VDFDIKIGDDVCHPVPELLTDKRVDCTPPTAKPNRHSDDNFCQDDALSINVRIQCYLLLHVNSSLVLDY